MEVSGQLHTLAALTTGKSHQYPTDRRLGGPQSKSGCSGGEKDLCHYWESNPGYPAHSPVTTLHIYTKR